MGQSDLNAGDKVLVLGAYQTSRSEWMILRYLSVDFIVAENQEGIEEVFDTSNYALEKYDRPVILDLGDDLCAAIERAAPHHLPSLTNHMMTAIANWRDATMGGCK